MFLELLALSAMSNSSDASSEATKAKNAALGLRGAGSIPIFIKFTDYNIEDESVSIFFSKRVLKPGEETTLNISNIKNLEDGIQDGVKFTKIKTFTETTYFSIKSQDEIQQLIMAEVQNLAKLLKDA